MAMATDSFDRSIFYFDDAKLDFLEETMCVLNGKWKLRIIVALSKEVCTFKDIQDAVDGISAHCLAKELRHLQLHGLVQKKINMKLRPLRIEYYLTKYVETLQDVFQTLSDWGQMHRFKRSGDTDCYEDLGRRKQESF